jgi:peroxiredoxin
VLAISADRPEDNARVVEDNGLAFPILSDQSLDAITSYGLLHRDGLGAGKDLAIPAQLLVRPDASIAWRHVATAIQDRPAPSEVLAAVESLGARVERDE